MSAAPGSDELMGHDERGVASLHGTVGSSRDDCIPVYLCECTVDRVREKVPPMHPLLSTGRFRRRPPRILRGEDLHNYAVIHSSLLDPTVPYRAVCSALFGGNGLLAQRQPQPMRERREQMRSRCALCATAPQYLAIQGDGLGVSLRSRQRREHLLLCWPFGVSVLREHEEPGGALLRLPVSRGP